MLSSKLKTHLCPLQGMLRSLQPLNAYVAVPSVSELCAIEISLYYILF